MRSVNFNGQLFPDRTPLLLSTNRAFNYGDGIFETMRIHKRKILFFEQHWQRLSQSMQQLEMEWPDEISAEDFHEECLKVYPGKGDYRIRATIWRAGEGLYTPQVNHVNFLIVGSELSTPPYPFNEKGLQIDLFEKIPVPNHDYSWIKSTQSLPYVQAALHRQKIGSDDCLLINNQGNLVEATSANLFLIQENQLITPPLSEGGIGGIIRTILLKHAPNLNYKSKEEPIDIERLLTAEEVFLTNSITGIRWVKRFKNTIFAGDKSKYLALALAKLAKTH